MFGEQQMEPLETLSEVSQIRRVCHMFDRSSQSGVQSLTLRGNPSLLSVASYFPRLVSLSSEISLVREEGLQLMIRELRRLSSHPTLLELSIDPFNSSVRQVPLMNNICKSAKIPVYKASLLWYMRRQL